MKYSKRTLSVALGGFVSLAGYSADATAQTQTWIRQWGTTTNDKASAAASDGSNGVYVGGYTDGSLGGQSAGWYDAWLARYDGAGNQIWIRQFGTGTWDFVSAAAPAGTSGVYLCGLTGGSLAGPNAGSSDVWLARYNSAGTQVWIRQFGTSEYDRPFSAAYDGFGGVFLCGYTIGGNLGGPSLGGYDGWIAHYDGGGNQSWIRQLGTSVGDHAWEVCLDGTGGVFVAGSTGGALGGPNAGWYDAWLARYDSTGTQLWLRQFGTSERDEAYAAALDGAGGVYVSGITSGSIAGPPAGSSDVWIARYDGAGNLIWIHQFGSSDNDAPQDAAPDGSGGFYLSGDTFGGLSGPGRGHVDAWLARFDSGGGQLWVRQLGTSVEDRAPAISPDGLGGAFVAGNTLGSLGGPSAGGHDAWVARYDGGLFASRFCAPAILNSSGRAGTLNASGSNAVMQNNVSLEARQLSLNSFGFFLTSRDQGNVFPVTNSQGRLCLGGLIGRYVGLGQIKNSGSTGTFSFVLDLTNMAHPFSPVSAQPGQTWYFQAWYRDANPTLTSNFTDAVSITFN